MRARRPVAEVLADPATPDPLRSQLEAVSHAREFARDLGLEVHDQYTSYVAWPGDRVITTVVATRPGEVTPAGFWFPFIGRLPYKGFFDRERAEAEAEALRRDGLDVCVVPVPAYSTLGWIADPVTTPMLLRGEGHSVETVIHELVHATVYVKEHVDFNETAATFIGQEASVRFYASRGAAESSRERRAAVEDQRALTAVLVGLRREVEDLYASRPAGPARDAARAGLDVQARARIARLPLASRDAAELAEAVRLNDACLALSGTYGADLDRFVARLERLDGDLEDFVARFRAAAEAEDPAAALLGP